MASIRMFLITGALTAACWLQAGQALADCQMRLSVVIPVTMVGMTPTATAKINGKNTTLVVDSGAFYSSITPAAAARLGLKVGSGNVEAISGVGGEARAGVTVPNSFEIAGATVPRHPFIVAPFAGAGIDGLFGEDFLGLGDVEYDLANGVVRIFRPLDCATTDLGYWARGRAAQMPLEQTAHDRDSGSGFNKHVAARATLNGQKISVMLDTGAGRTILTQAAAARAGVLPTPPGSVSRGQVAGVGPHIMEVWQAPFQTLALGDEQIQNTTLEFGPVDLSGSDMLLGADFFLSHRVFVSNSQRKVYMTYNGGPVFRFDKVTLAAAAPPAPIPGDNDAPKDADGFRRRSAAFVARQDYVRAIADLTQVIALEPGNAQAYYARATARLGAGDRASALADLDEAIKRDPGYKEARVARGALYLAQKAPDKAKIDLEAAVAADPPGGVTALQVAGVYEGANQFAEALSLFDRWLTANPKNPAAAAALNGRCWARAVLKQDLDQALADCNAAVKLADLPSFLDSRGLVRLDRGELDQAIADYDAAIKQQPKAAITLYARGVAKLKKGLKPAGDADIAAALAIDPKVADQAKRYGIVVAEAAAPKPSL